MTPREHLLTALRDAYARAEAVCDAERARCRHSPRAFTARVVAAQLRELVRQEEAEVELERVRGVRT